TLIGSGDRSDRIRTYNFPQNRLTDHRINLTLYKLDAIMTGEMGELIEALRAHDRKERLAQAAQQGESSACSPLPRVLGRGEKKNHRLTTDAGSPTDPGRPAGTATASGTRRPANRPCRASSRSSARPA